MLSVCTRFRAEPTDKARPSNVSGLRSGQSVQPDVMTNMQTPLDLRLKGPAKVYASAVVTQ